MTTFATPVQADFAAAGWRIEAEEARRETHLGREALFLRNGRATLADVELTDCLLEVDVLLGADEYRSRDYRFLSSIGWWDSLYVDLEAGENELVVAVSEDFGGWGLQARFPDPSGLTFGS